MQNIKTYNFNSILDRDAILEKLTLFKNELINDAKFISLTIQLINHSNKKDEVIEVEIISDFKINIQTKSEKKISMELYKNILFLRNNIKISSDIDLKTLKFKEVKFLYTPITYYQFVNKDEIYLKINKMIKKN